MGLENERINQAEMPQDWVKALALGLIRNGENVYRDINRRTGKRTYNQHLLERQKDDAKAKVFAGAILLTIKDTIETGVYNHAAFANTVNQALDFGAVEIRKDRPAMFSTSSNNNSGSTLDTYDAYLGEDNSLSIFLEYPEMLPDPMHNELLRHNLVEPIKQLGSVYRETAIGLLSPTDAPIS